VHASRRLVLWTNGEWDTERVEECLPFFTLGKPKWARIKNSLPPASCFIFHTNALLSGAYWTLPVEAYGVLVWSASAVH
jgi:hypothetical protein